MTSTKLEKLEKRNRARKRFLEGLQDLRAGDGVDTLSFVTMAKKLTGAGLQVSKDTVSRWMHLETAPRPESVQTGLKALRLIEQGLTTADVGGTSSKVKAKQQELPLEKAAAVEPGLEQAVGYMEKKLTEAAEEAFARRKKLEEEYLDQLQKSKESMARATARGEESLAIQREEVTLLHDIRGVLAKIQEILQTIPSWRESPAMRGTGMPSGTTMIPDGLGGWKEKE